MDELKESPRIDWLYELAQKLRKAPAALGRANPVLGRLAESGKEMLTEPIARGLENWAYGDRMFGPPANAPLVNERTGDMLSALPLGALGSAPKGVATAALYAGTKRPELMISHSTQLKNLLRNGELPKELYHTSFGVTNDRLMNEFGPVTVLPQLRKVDPRTAPVTVHAIDAYTPRHAAGAGDRADEILSDETRQVLDEFGDPGAYQRLLREQANARNADRMISSWRSGGLGSEVSNWDKKSMVKGLPEYGQGGFRIGGEPMKYERGNPKALALRGLSYGPRFQSWQDFEKLPTGAARLAGGPEHTDVYKDVVNFVKENAPLANKRFGITLDQFDPEVMLNIDHLGENHRVAQFLQSARMGGPGYSPKTVADARALSNALSKTRSQYAEAKHWGPFQMNPENVAGIMADVSRGSGMTYKEINELERAAKLRGIPFGTMDYSKDYSLGYTSPADIAFEMQSKRR